MNHQFGGFNKLSGPLHKLIINTLSAAFLWFRFSRRWWCARFGQVSGLAVSLKSAGFPDAKWFEHNRVSSFGDQCFQLIFHCLEDNFHLDCWQWLVLHEKTPLPCLLWQPITLQVTALLCFCKCFVRPPKWQHSNLCYEHAHTIQRKT